MFILALLTYLKKK
ncbi:hypothetical protein M3661_29050 [Paenibacillus sp. MER 180]|nr:hypothetical protein [Paenibacillus sp. MER 180]UJF36252.1 hypothetical protein L0M14_03915 [Paenibacillus sp. YPD9-1]